jgi:hypothetical protein
MTIDTLQIRAAYYATEILPAHLDVRKRDYHLQPGAGPIAGINGLGRAQF